MAWACSSVSAHMNWLTTAMFGLVCVVAQLVEPLRVGVVVGVDPGHGGVGRHELEPEGAEAAPARHLDRVELAARHPQRRMRLLAGLGHDVAQREVEELAVVLPALLPEHRHEAAHGVLPHGALVAEAAVERVQLGDARSLADAQLDPAVADEVERADPLGDPGRVVGGELHDAVAEADALACAGWPRPGTPRAPTSGCTPRGSGAPPPRRSRSRAGRPARSGRARAGCSSYSSSRLPRLGQLQLVEDPELHATSPGSTGRRLYRLRRALQLTAAERDGRRRVLPVPLVLARRRSATRCEPRPALRGDLDADVAIVGAGYTGLWTAYYLSEADPWLRIVVLERRHRRLRRVGPQRRLVLGVAADQPRRSWPPATAATARWRCTGPWSTPSTRSVGSPTRRTSTATSPRAARSRSPTAPPQTDRIRAEIAAEHDLGLTDDDVRWLGPSEAAGRRSPSTGVRGAAFTPALRRRPSGPAGAGPGRGGRGGARRARSTSATPVLEIGPKVVRTERGTVRAPRRGPGHGGVHRHASPASAAPWPRSTR